jgi:hypothetical protein
VSERRGLTVVAAVVTVVGLPAVLVTGALLRHVGHVSPAVTNAAELRLRLLGHDVPCDDPVVERPPLRGAATALTCAGPGAVPLRLAAYANAEARAAAPAPAGLVVSGANWRVELPAAARPLADRLARALTGTVTP